MPDYETTQTFDTNDTDTPEQDSAEVEQFDEDVDFDGNDGEDDEVEFVADGTATGTNGAAKPAKAPKEPARGALPDGYVTPVGLAHELNKRQLGKTDEAGNYVEIPPQQVYSYIRNAPAAHPFPLEELNDSLGKPRKVVRIDAGVQWWEAKNERAAARKNNAAAKAQAAAAKAQPSETPTVSADDAGPMEEAE
jgi:hypothetical protein